MSTYRQRGANGGAGGLALKTDRIVRSPCDNVNDGEERTAAGTSDGSKDACRILRRPARGERVLIADAATELCVSTQAYHRPQCPRTLTRDEGDRENSEAEHGEAGTKRA